jgi:glycosyltransferase involved in cell wall biosynthesis
MYKVSVLIPVYNVEKYLSKCLESIINQTYKNIEIILINDGTQDSSLDIANAYASKYNFIKVYSYENSGISKTRNRALEKATGDYYLFVDSDDYISSDMIEKMVACALDTNSDIVTCGYKIEWHGLGLPIFPLHAKTMDSLEALRALSQNIGINNYPWGKLYAASCFKDVQFPDEKKGFEDTYTVFKAIYNANRVTIMKNCFYHYVKRKGSITDHMDLVATYEMRAAYEYQELCLHQWYPNENFYYDLNFYNSDMVILYTLIFFYSRKDNPVFAPSVIDWSKIGIFKRIGYIVWRAIACIKFGWSLKWQEE